MPAHDQGVADAATSQRTQLSRRTRTSRMFGARPSEAESGKTWRAWVSMLTREREREREIRRQVAPGGPAKPEVEGMRNTHTRVSVHTTARRVRPLSSLESESADMRAFRCSSSRVRVSRSVGDAGAWDSRRIGRAGARSPTSRNAAPNSRNSQDTRRDSICGSFSPRHSVVSRPDLERSRV